MANWIPITLAELDDAKIAKLVDALRQKALRAGQTDPTPRLTQKVVNRIRRKIGNNPNNKLDADETKIPKGLLGVATVLILAEMKGRLEMALTTDENKAVDRADTDLQAVADGEAVEEPDDPIAANVQTTAGSPTITEKRREERNARNSG